MAKSANLKRLLIMSVLLVAIHCATAVGRPIYVDANASPGGDGSSWATAFKYLQDALADANSDPDPNDIWVAAGVYTPDSDAAEPNGTGDRTATFQLISGVGLYGGFPSGGDPNWNDRDPNVHETILSGDLDGNDVLVISDDYTDLLYEPTRGENSYNVVSGSGVERSAVLNRFTIIGGNADISHVRHKYGGGMYNDAGSPTVVQCRFTQNSAMNGGGAISNSHNSDSVIIECTFFKNGALSGGGMYNNYSSPTLTDCVFNRNMAMNGGGVMNYRSNPLIMNCAFIVNSASFHGGGVVNWSSPNVALTNSTFRGNLAVYGGGIWNYDSEGTLANCTFTGNAAVSGGGVYTYLYSDVVLNNCILWDEFASSGSELFVGSSSYPSTVTVSHTDIRGGQPGAHVDPNCTLIWESGAIDEDPRFAQPGYWVDANDPNIVVEPNDPNAMWIDGDYHLKSEGGRWDPCAASWVLDDVTSPCIDTGDPCTSFAAELSPHGCRVNMGAYGNTEQASKSAVMASLCCESYECAGQPFGDATCDGNVNLADLYALKAAFGTSAPWADKQCCADFSHDGNVDLADLFALKAGFATSGYSPSTGNQNCPP